MPNAQLGLPAPGAAGSLGANKAIVISTPGGATRSALLYPFPATDPRNVSIGSAATYDSRSMLGTGGARLNDISFGLSVKGAGYAYVAQLDTAENHHCDYQADGRTVWGFNTFMGAGLHTTTDAITGQSWDVHVIGNAGQYERATKMSGLAGPLRLWEMQAAIAGDVTAIRHVIDMGLCSQVFNSVAVWPATAVDSFSGTNTGFSPYGALWGIPPGVAAPGGLNPLQLALQWTGVHYGFRGVDASGQGGTFSVIEAEAAAHSLSQQYLIASTASSDLNAGTIAVLQQARMVTNNNQANIGGPGARLDPRPVPAFA